MLDLSFRKVQQKYDHIFKKVDVGNDSKSLIVILERLQFLSTIIKIEKTIMKNVLLFLSLFAVSSQFLATGNQTLRPKCPTTPPSPKGKRSLDAQSRLLILQENR